MAEPGVCELGLQLWHSPARRHQPRATHTHTTTGQLLRKKRGKMFFLLHHIQSRTVQHIPAAPPKALETGFTLHIAHKNSCHRPSLKAITHVSRACLCRITQCKFALLVLTCWGRSTRKCSLELPKLPGIHYSRGADVYSLCSIIVAAHTAPFMRPGMRPGTACSGSTISNSGTTTR